MGSQCKYWKTGVMWSRVSVPATNIAAAFWRRYRGSIVACGRKACRNDVSIVKPDCLQQATLHRECAGLILVLSRRIWKIITADNGVVASGPGRDRNQIRVDAKILIINYLFFFFRMPLDPISQTCIPHPYIFIRNFVIRSPYCFKLTLF